VDLSAGSHLEPVADHHRVLRLARPPKDYASKGNILAIQLDVEFQLSSADKQSVPPHLSVWVQALTTSEQAYSFLQENIPNSPRKLVLCLGVEEICQIVGSAGNGNGYPNVLAVIWVHLFQKIDGEPVRDDRPGAKGHSGITGLDAAVLLGELTKAQAKLLRKDLRSQLAELASRDHFLLKL
jgi:hypothetical protein